jgi:hypothetical protein
MQIRVTNITNEITPAGEFIDLGPSFGNYLLRAGASWQGEVGESVPQLFIEWATKGKVRVVRASDQEPMYGPVADITPKTVSPFREMNSVQDSIDEEEPDLEEAVEAALPVQTGSRGSHMPSTEQVYAAAPKVRVSLGETVNDVNVVDNDISPIPGDRPRNVDNSDKFTVKAPSYQAVGGVVGKR